MKASKIYLSAILAFLLFTGLSLAQNQGKMGPRGHNGPGFNKQNMVMNLPGITDKQKEEIKKIRLSGMKAMQPIKNQIGEKQAKLRTLETSSQADMKAINKVIEEISALRTAQAKLRAGNLQKIRNLLNDEQRVIFDSKPHGPRGVGHGKSMRQGHHKGNRQNCGCQGKNWIEN